MAGPMRFRNPAGYPGLRANLAAFVSSGARFLESRLSLASKEAKGAVLHLVTLVACGIAAVLKEDTEWLKNLDQTKATRS